MVTLEIVMRSIVLASTSPYRRQLLARLRVAFEIDAPAVDETPLPLELPRAIAQRLARNKALAVEPRHRDAIIIGADQVADDDGQPLGKPGDHAAALEQLQSLQGRTVVFHTALAVLDSASGQLREDSVPTTVRFRTLPRAVLDAYLRLDTPYDCAGAAKAESLGIMLLESVQSDDPTALIGLPLIRLTTLLMRNDVLLPVA